MIRNFIFINILYYAIMAVFSSCSSENDCPTIESTWKNIASEPVEEITCAYPGQTICLRGSGFKDLKRIIVNGTKINMMSTLMYDTDNSITFKIPSDVDTSIKPSTIKLVTVNGDTTYTGLLIKPTKEQPLVRSFSATNLQPGNTLVITGSNLDGATEVYLPLCFEQNVKCKFDETKENTATNLYVQIPSNVYFAKGKCLVVMQKKDDAKDTTYIEKAYSATTDFSNK